MATRTEIVKILTDYIEMYPGTRISGKGLALYAENLAEFDAARLREAMNNLLRTCKYFPTVAEICELLESSAKRDVFTPSREDLEAYKIMMRDIGMGND